MDFCGASARCRMVCARMEAVLAKLIRSREAGEILDATPRSVRALVHRGVLATAGRDEQGWLFDPAVVEELAASGVFKPNHGGRREHPEAAVEAALQALAQAGEPMDAVDLGLAIERDPGNVRKYLTVLRARGFVTRVSGGADHTVTPSGTAHLAAQNSTAIAS